MNKGALAERYVLSLHGQGQGLAAGGHGQSRNMAHADGEPHPAKWWAEGWRV